MGTSHSSIDSYRDDSRFSSCTTRHPTKNLIQTSFSGAFRRFFSSYSEVVIGKNHWNFNENRQNKTASKIIPKLFFGADDEIRVFEPVAITRLQVVENISTHSFHQKSHSFSLFAKSRCNLSSSFSSTLGESKFKIRVSIIVCLYRQHPTKEFSLHPYHRHL